MNILSLIRKKRDAGYLQPSEINELITEYSNDRVPDYQMSAFLMAAFLNGLNTEETTALTDTMLHSGKVLKWDELSSYAVDKHSTGGVGDKTSIILAPIVAAAGLSVPMISGRGLGHTGGTLDKLGTIPGFSTSLTLEQFRNVVKEVGCGLIGQTAEIAPADKKLYALRDATSTVEYIPFICSSIMSKKLAEGVDGLVLDVKTGSGAFMKETEDALELAQSLVAIASSANRDVIAWVTDQNQPLGNYVGNYLEILECVQGLKGKLDNDLMDVSYLLAGTMIYLGNRSPSIREGMKMAKSLVEDGSAWEKFLEIVKAQGGDSQCLIDESNPYTASYEIDISAPDSGYIHQLDAFRIGLAGVELGAGRHTKEDEIDPAAGFQIVKKIGDFVAKGETILRAYTNKPDMENQIKSMILSGVQIDSDLTEPLELVKYMVTPSATHAFNPELLS